MFIIFSVFYILVAAAMTVLILIQRGEGANAGASFGGGSSGTVFGASGSASFMSRATAVLFAVFILLSLGMAVYLTHAGAPKQTTDLGVMAGVGTTTTAPAVDAAAAKAAAGATPVQPAAAGSAGASHSPAAKAEATTGNGPDQSAPSADAKSGSSATTGKGDGTPAPKKN